VGKIKNEKEKEREKKRKCTVLWDSIRKIRNWSSKVCLTL
jgi:hypothetical protein